MEVIDRPEPGPAEPGFVVVRPEAIGLCGSDFHYFHGDMGSVRDDELYPRVQGHEFSAIVEDVGADCPPGLAAGQRVAVWPVIECGTCHACRIGRGNACEQISLIGIHMDGALQYVDDYRGFLEALGGYRAQYLLIVDVRCGDHATFASSQQNIPGSAVDGMNRAARVLGFPELAEE